MCTHFTAELSFEREAFMMDTVGLGLGIGLGLGLGVRVRVRDRC